MDDPPSGTVYYSLMGQVFLKNHVFESPSQIHHRDVKIDKTPQLIFPKILLLKKRFR